MKAGHSRIDHLIGLSVLAVLVGLIVAALTGPGIILILGLPT